MSFKIRSELVRNSEPMRFRRRGRLHHNVRIYLTSDDEDALNRIASVQYTLHPTFRERVRVSTEVHTQFGITIWTYGYFRVEGVLFFKNGAQETIRGFVSWKDPGARSGHTPVD